MGAENLGIVRQYSFDQGPNYTDSPWILNEDELAASSDVFWDGTLKQIPGASRIISAEFPGGPSNNVNGMGFLALKSGVNYLVAMSSGGRVEFYDSGAWGNIGTGLISSNTWTTATFNDTLIMASGVNPVKKWTAVGAISNLGGSPPVAKYVSQHAVDFLLLAGQSSDPAEIRYCDTANHESWPIGNALVVGRNEGTPITGIQVFGESTVILKRHSIWLLSGNTPADFTLSPTPSQVGCIAPNSVVLTEYGVFFWSEAGPALFNGFKTTLLGHRIKRLMEESLDWLRPGAIIASYYPRKKQVWVAYARRGVSGIPDRMIMIDLDHVDKYTKLPGVCWPIQASGCRSMTSGEWAEDGQRRIFFGHDGFVTVIDEEQFDFNAQPITPRIRTRLYSLGKPDHTLGLRSVDLRLKVEGEPIFPEFFSSIKVSHAVDGSEIFNELAQSPRDLDPIRGSSAQFRLQGASTEGEYGVGNFHWIEIEKTFNGESPIVDVPWTKIIGIELALEDLGRRGDLVIPPTGSGPNEPF